MPKFITTTETAYLIEKMITDAAKFICILSPYLAIHSRLKKIIEEKSKKTKDIKIIFVCRESELKKREREWIEALSNSIIFYNPTLHAKCYFTEKFAIVTSLNLIEYSMVNNIEFGFSLEKGEDLFGQVINECVKLFDENSATYVSSAFAEPLIRKSATLADLKGIMLEI